MMPMQTLRYHGVDHVLPQDAEDHREVEDESQGDQSPIPDRSPIPPISDESPIPEVRATVSTIDDPAPALTIRVGIIGPLVTFLVAHLKTLELFKDNVFDIPMVVIQFCFGLLVGRAMAAILPERVFRVRGTQFQFSLNPEPFNSKEHALICVFAYIATMRPNLLQTLAISKAYFHKDIHWPVAYAATLSSYLMCFLFVGLFTPHLVSAAHMWWPMELVDVAFFRTWHDNTEGSLGNISSKKFFTIFFVLGSIYQIIIGFLFPFISYISFLCLIWKKSETARQIGSGKNGLGLFSFSMDWSSFNSSTGDPLATPRLVILNLLVGYLITLYMVIPSVYWSNAFGSKNFPMMSTDPYDAYGHPYNFSRVLNSNGTFNEAAYTDYSNVHWTALTVVLYSLLLGSVATSLVQVVMDRELYKNVEEDIHNRLMRRYQPVPRSWFITISTLAFVLAIICGSAPFGPEVNFPISAVLAACVSALIVVIPLGIFAATTGEMLPVNAAFGLIGGFLFSNKLFDCMIYNNFAYQIATNTVQFMGFLKLAHFMQISLRAMWAVMVVASLIVCSVSFHETWYQVNKPENPCVQQELPAGSSSSNCPMLDMYFNRFNMWGIIGSRRIISDGNYGTFLLFVIVVSVVAQVVLSLLARRWKFLYAIKLPIVLAASAEIPFAGTANVNTWLLVGLVFPVIAYTRVRGWSPKWQYLLATALSGGTAFSSGMLLHFIRKLIDSPKWWGSTLDDHCSLASPTAPGITVERFVWH